MKLNLQVGKLCLAFWTGSLAVTFMVAFCWLIVQAILLCYILANLFEDFALVLSILHIALFFVVSIKLDILAFHDVLETKSLDLLDAFCHVLVRVVFWDMWNLDRDILSDTISFQMVQ